MPGLSVSVVIPTYNRAHLLQRALDSALEQTRDGDEVIVVDDGSTDGTPELLEEYADRIRVVRGERAGGAAARNRGTRAARCDLVAFLDSDDEWFPGKLDMQREVLEKRRDVLFVFGEFASTLADGTPQRRHLWNWHRDPRSWNDIVPNPVDFSSIGELPEGVDDFAVHIGDMFPQMAHRLYVLTSSYIARRIETGDALHYDEDLEIYEDWGCFSRVAQLGPGAFLDTELAWQHGHDGDRISDARDLARSTCHLILLDRIYEGDAEYRSRHAGEYDALREGLRERRAADLIFVGRLSDARAELSRMKSPPFSFRVLAHLPAPLVGVILDLRRRLRG